MRLFMYDGAEERIKEKTAGAIYIKYGPAVFWPAGKIRLLIFRNEKRKRRILCGISSGGSAVYNGNPSLTVRHGIFFSYNAFKLFCDVINQYLIIQHSAVLEKLIITEHGKAVSAVFNHIIMGGHGIGFGRIQRNAINKHMGYPVFPVNPEEFTFIIPDYGRRDGSME